MAPRSGLALKRMIDVGAGVIDRDYTGLCSIVLFNFGPDAFRVTKGDRVAQIIFEKICSAPFVPGVVHDSTSRGARGFGSSGVGCTGGAGADSASGPAVHSTPEVPPECFRKDDYSRLYGPVPAGIDSLDVHFLDYGDA